MGAVGRAFPARLDAALLASALLTAWLLAGAHAFIRPLFQVSDELNYLHTVQVKALALGTESDRACLAPPDGSTLSFAPLGGKFAFHHVSARLLLAACRGGAGPLAIPLTRAALALSLPLLVAFTWALGRVAAPDRAFVAHAAAIVTACQPVLATFSGGVAPDGMANAASAGALLVSAHLLLNRASGLWLLAMAACALVAVASKDSALFLAPLTLVVGSAWVAGAGWRRAALVVVLGLAGAALLATSGALPLLATPFPNLGRVLTDAIAHPAAFLGVVASAYAANAMVIASSGLAGLSNFGGGVLELPRGLWLAQLGLLVVGLAGFVAATVARQDADGRTLRFAGLVGVAVTLEAIQIPVRQMMTDSIGPIQGRWLFPVWPLVIVASMLGWAWLLRRRALPALPLLTILSAVTAASALVRVVEYYYARWPATYAWPHVFLLAAEGYDAGTSVARAMVAATVVPAALRNGILLAAGAALVTLLLMAAAVAARRPAESSDVRHTHHR